MDGNKNKDGETRNSPSLFLSEIVYYASQESKEALPPAPPANWNNTVAIPPIRIRTSNVMMKRFATIAAFFLQDFSGLFD
jgi:hypothetical protein